MKYKTLLEELQKLTPDELKQDVVLFYGDGGTYSDVISFDKTEKEDENLGCEEIGDGPSGWKKGQWYLTHTC